MPLPKGKVQTKPIGIYDVSSALTLLQIGAVLKFSPLHLAKGKLELIRPKSEKWREDVLNAF